MRQRDLNLLIGNSSVAHMGFAFLGIASLSLIGITGTVVVMVAHGFLAALTFALSGYLRDEVKTLDMDQMGGLLRQLPFIGTVMIMAMLAGCGLPGFAGFPGEMLVLFGNWQRSEVVGGLGGVGRADHCRCLHAARHPRHLAWRQDMAGLADAERAVAQAALRLAAGGFDRLWLLSPALDRQYQSQRGAYGAPDGQ